MLIPLWDLLCLIRIHFRPLDEACELVSFGTTEEYDVDNDAMSTAASGSGDGSCQKSEAPSSEVREPPTAIEEELLNILTEAVNDLGLDWS